jgi:hypothetical protein
MKNPMPTAQASDPAVVKIALRFRMIFILCYGIAQYFCARKSGPHWGGVALIL